MTIDSSSDWPDDPDDPDDPDGHRFGNHPERIVDDPFRGPVKSPVGAPFSSPFDGPFDGPIDHDCREGLCQALDDGPEFDEQLYVEMLIDRDNARLADVYTRGLWDLGLPELCVSPPPSFNLSNELDWGRLAVLLGTALINLGGELLAADDFDVPPYLDEFDGRPVQLWLRDQEPVEGRLALALGEVDTLLRVECSLWASAQPAWA